MPRKPRIEYPGAFYHVISRGNRGQDIFHVDSDRRRCLDKVREYRERYEFLLYAYTLMPNHTHFVLETLEVPLSRIMQGLLQSYTQYYNQKYVKVGHLFQGRYKAILCDKDAYLLQLVRYLHLNSVRAGLVDAPADYPWSSHRVYLGLEQDPMVNRDAVLKLFSQEIGEARRLYEAFVLEAIHEGSRDEYYRTVDQRLLGGEEFVKEVEHKATEGSVAADETFRARTVEEIAEVLAKATGVKWEAVRGRSRGPKEIQARTLFVHLCLQYTRAKRREIAEALGRDPKMVTYLERRLSEEDRRLLDGIRDSWV